MEKSVRFVESVDSFDRALQFVVRREAEVGPDPEVRVRPVWFDGRREFEVVVKGIVDE